ncbi:MAG: hypothetical protein BVN35_12465 [Proteobacteria bacterium ST_bin11]|nr:MAG: hypothetical protein BVN35_12465 [Proteobacteria bacterium ST_bin11]
MKILSILLATFLYSASANAALQFNFSGNFVNFTTGTFEGQLNFDVFSPKSSEFKPALGGEQPVLNLRYSVSPALSLMVKDEFGVEKQFKIDNNAPVVIDVIDDLTISETQITDRGFTNDDIKPGTYDFMGLRMESSPPGDDLSFQKFSVLAFFDKNLLDSTDLENPNFQGVFELRPSYVVFEINRELGDSADFRGAGKFTASEIIDTTPVPLPGAVWLFGSVIAGLGYRMRKQA